MPLASLLSWSIPLSENLFRMGGINPAQNAIHRVRFARQSEEKHLMHKQSVNVNNTHTLYHNVLIRSFRLRWIWMTQQTGPNLQYSWLALNVTHPVNTHLFFFLSFSSVSTKEDQFSVSIQPAVGELLMPSIMKEQDFCKEQGESHVHQCLLNKKYKQI